MCRCKGRFLLADWCWCVAQGSEGDISFFPHMMEPGDDVKVRDRLLEVLEAVVVGEEAEARARL